MCRAMKVLCVATDTASLMELKKAAVSAGWELAPGATDEAGAIGQIDAERPHVLVVFGPYERLIALVSERFRGCGSSPTGTRPGPRRWPPRSTRSGD